jgi:hypothetical protein
MCNSRTRIHTHTYNSCIYTRTRGYAPQMVADVVAEAPAGGAPAAAWSRSCEELVACLCGGHPQLLQRGQELLVLMARHGALSSAHVDMVRA